MSIEICETVSSFRDACSRARGAGARVGLVPTMGALHEGHATLMREAARRANHVAVTIFVNPTQFGPTEDLARYPRDLEGDLRTCEKEGVRTVFAPNVSEMYPTGERTRVRVDGLTAGLCGSRRPGHFEGVTTIVAKLFAVAGPCVAVFGRKDYQQLKVIERMTRDLLLPVEIVGYPTVRESDGLALSSRNRYLTADERWRALSIPRALADAVRRHERGERRVSALTGRVTAAIEGAGGRVDYVNIAGADDLQVLAEDADVGDRAVLAVAAFFGATRLIDNVVFGEDPAPEVAP